MFIKTVTKEILNKAFNQMNIVADVQLKILNYGTHIQVIFQLM